MDILSRSSDFIAVLALAVSAYAAWKTIRFNELQKSLIETQERLNRLLLEKEIWDATTNKKADLGATIVKLANSNYRLKIWNKGKVAAKNVSIFFPEGNELVDDEDVSEKFPLESLDTHQSVDLVAFVGMDTKSKHVIRLTWSDDSNLQNEKIVYATL